MTQRFTLSWACQGCPRRMCLDVTADVPPHEHASVKPHCPVPSCNPAAMTYLGWQYETQEDG